MGFVDYTKNAFRKQNMYKSKRNNNNKMTSQKDTVWIDLTKEEKIKPVTRDEALAHVTKKLESEIFIERNCSSLKTEDQIARLTLILQYIKDNLK